VEAFTAPEITSKKASSSEKTGVFLGTVAAVFEIVGVLAVGRGAFNGMLGAFNGLSTGCYSRQTGLYSFCGVDCGQY